MNSWIGETVPLRAEFNVVHKLHHLSACWMSNGRKLEAVFIYAYSGLLMIHCHSPANLHKVYLVLIGIIWVTVSLLFYTVTVYVLCRSLGGTAVGSCILQPHGFSKLWGSICTSSTYAILCRGCICLGTLALVFAFVSSHISRSLLERSLLFNVMVPVSF